MQVIQAKGCKNANINELVIQYLATVKYVLYTTCMSSSIIIIIIIHWSVVHVYITFLSCVLSCIVTHCSHRHSIKSQQKAYNLLNFIIFKIPKVLCNFENFSKFSCIYAYSMYQYSKRSAHHMITCDIICHVTFGYRFILFR